MIFSLLLAVGFAVQIQLTTTPYQNSPYFVLDTEPRPNDSGGVDPAPPNTYKLAPSFVEKFNDKFSCFHDSNGVYERWADSFYPNDDNSDAYYCCGTMANGRWQCDKMKSWKQVGDNRFSLCDDSYSEAIAEVVNGGSTPKLRRDLCCENDHFNNCNLCSSFMVWDFTIDPVNSHGGDPILEQSLLANNKVTLSPDWRTTFNSQPAPETANGEGYPPYAYDNNVYPGGFARAKLREYNDPPVCVYAPNVAGRVIEIKVEPEESGSQICVDDLHEDSLEKNAPGVTQACDDSRLQTCFSDANSADSGGFAFLISCSESCADSDVDLWFRLRASVNKWTEAGDEAKGTDQTEVNTEMWCMWGNQDMRDDEGNSVFPDSFPPELDGNFAKWDVYPSDLTPEEDPIVRPVENSVSMLSFGIALLSVLALF